MGQGEPAGENQRTQRGARQVGIDAADQERTRHISRAQSIPTNSAQVRLGEGKGSEVPEPASEVVLDQSAGVLQGAGEVGLEELRQLEPEPRAADALRLRFAAPVRSGYRDGIQPIFVAWGPTTCLASNQPQWRLFGIRWRWTSEGVSDVAVSR
jgi:hypothetical protein